MISRTTDLYEPKQDSFKRDEVVLQFSYLNESAIVDFVKQLVNDKNLTSKEVKITKAQNELGKIKYIKVTAKKDITLDDKEF